MYPKIETIIKACIVTYKVIHDTGFYLQYITLIIYF